MKQILIAIIILLLIVIVFQTCWYKKHCYDTGAIKSPKTFCEDSICFGNDGSALQGMIHNNLAMKMARDYANELGKKYIYNGDVKTDSLDSKSIWFDLKRIKQFIGYIESTLCKDSCLQTDHYGIRIYYAKYPDSAAMKDYPELDDVPRSYANHHTVFMVPTYWNEERGMNIDFDPAKRTTNCRLLPMDSTSKDVFGVFFRVAGSTSQEQNHGSLMPPPASGGTYPQN